MKDLSGDYLMFNMKIQRIYLKNIYKNFRRGCIPLHPLDPSMKDL